MTEFRIVSQKPFAGSSRDGWIRLALTGASRPGRRRWLIRPRSAAVLRELDRRARLRRLDPHRPEILIADVFQRHCHDAGRPVDIDHPEELQAIARGQVLALPGRAAFLKTYLG